MNQAKSEVLRGSRPLTHLDEAGETYFQHMACAFSFAGRMIWGGLCVFVHGFYPNVLCKKGSTCIERLYEDMIAHRKEFGERRLMKFSK